MRRAMIDLINMNDRGSVIVIVLMVMVLVTIIGFAAMNTSRTDMNIVENERKFQLYNNRAENGLKFALANFENLQSEANWNSFYNYVSELPTVSDLNKCFSTTYTDSDGRLAAFIEVRHIHKSPSSSICTTSQANDVYPQPHIGPANEGEGVDTLTRRVLITVTAYTNRDEDGDGTLDLSNVWVQGAKGVTVLRDSVDPFIQAAL